MNNSSEYSAMLDYTGRNVVITGGLSGAGREISEVFLRSGANVILTYNRSARAADEIRRSWPGRDILCLQLDQSDPDSIDRFLSELRSAGFGGGDSSRTIDCLVNNAGIYPAREIDDISLDEWDAMLDTNTKGVFFLSKGVIPMMDHGHTGASSIVNISSINATNPARKLAHYGISKAAVEMMTRNMAQCYGPDIRVNCIAPGLIYKEGQDEFIPGWTDSYKERSALHKLVQAEDIGKTCLFLASDLASAITGQVITVDCGIMLAPCFFND